MLSLERLLRVDQRAVEKRLCPLYLFWGRMIQIGLQLFGQHDNSHIAPPGLLRVTSHFFDPCSVKNLIIQCLVARGKQEPPKAPCSQFSRDPLGNSNQDLVGLEIRSPLVQRALSSFLLQRRPMEGVGPRAKEYRHVAHAVVFVWGRTTPPTQSHREWRERIRQRTNPIPRSTVSRKLVEKKNTSRSAQHRRRE
ncbi:hypothetical protein B296_00011961 [Ensete ventricosum]|uniref:Uncharacterized protein n=1 Tax=Ensete ventricosum TaxID=4639 RepID=A0A427B904_ENSVE|nr:hypothetical protein B296_00011961 [Ensete ventricosum]